MGWAVILMNWEDPGKGMWVNLTGVLTKAEAIKVYGIAPVSSWYLPLRTRTRALGARPGW